MGARPIAVLDSLRFGPPGSTHRAARNRRIIEGVVAGIAHYGNCFGVPTVGGECIFEPCYNGNPLVNVFALGVCQEDEIFYARASGIGNPVIYVARKPAATAFMARPWRPPNSPRSPNRNGPTSRSAIPFSKNCCSKPASKP